MTGTNVTFFLLSSLKIKRLGGLVRVNLLMETSFSGTQIRKMLINQRVRGGSADLIGPAGMALHHYLLTGLPDVSMHWVPRT